MNKKIRQLALFKDLTAEIDHFVHEFENKLGDYKYVALQLESQFGRNSKPVEYALEIARTFSDLAAILAREGTKYRTRTGDYWEARKVYDPFFKPVEPRSISSLVNLCLDYQSRSNSLLLRFKAILGSSVYYPHKFVEN